MRPTRFRMVLAIRPATVGSLTVASIDLTIATPGAVATSAAAHSACTIQVGRRGEAILRLRRVRLHGQPEVGMGRGITLYADPARNRLAVSTLESRGV